MNIKTNIREYFQIRREAKILALRNLNEQELNIYNLYKVLLSCFFVFLITGILGFSFLFIFTKYDILNVILASFIGILFIFSMGLIVFSSDNQTLINETNAEIRSRIPDIHYDRYKTGKVDLSNAMSQWLTLNDPDNYYMQHEIKNYDKERRIFSDIMKSDINHQDGNVDTLLHYMLQTDPDSPFIAKALLMNADIHIKNNKGVSAYDLLVKYHPEYISFIEKTLLHSTTYVKSDKRNINRL